VTPPLLEAHLDWATVGQLLAAWLVVFGMLWRLGQRVTKAGRAVVQSTRANTAALVRLDHRIETLELIQQRRLDRADADDLRGRRPPPMERRT
jgi:hypothetical protein